MSGSPAPMSHNIGLGLVCPLEDRDPRGVTTRNTRHSLFARRLACDVIRYRVPESGSSHREPDEAGHRRGGFKPAHDLGFIGAAAEFAKWNKANKKVMAGLTRRRAAESALYAKP